MVFSQISTGPIAARAAREAIDRSRLESARRVANLRIMGVGAGFLIFLVFGRALGLAEHRGADVVLGLELVLACLVRYGVHRSDRFARFSGFGLALLDVPALGLTELTLLASAPNPAELVAFNGATLVVIVLASTLFLSPGPIVATALSASVCHGVLQLQAGGHPSHLASTALVFGLAAGVCLYGAIQLSGLVVNATVRGLGLERAERILQAQRDKLLASEARFRSLLDVAPDGAFLVHDGRISYANKPFAKLLGYSADELSGYAIEAIVAADDRKRVLDPEVLNSGASDPREVRFETASGDTRHVEIVGRPVEIQGVSSWLFLTRDLTERRLLEAQLVSADRMASMGLLAAGVAHEINTPLAIVAASLEYLEDELSTKSETGLDWREPLGDARLATKRVSEIVRDLRLFSRAELPATPVDIEGAIDSAVRMASRELRQRAHLERIHSEVPRVYASESRLGQVFLNLLNNAAQAIPEGSRDSHRVVVRTYTGADGSVVVEVTDTGSGIPPEHVKRIFQPFFSTKQQAGGSGLGLAICARIVSDMAGRIEVESQIGRGSTFRILLPPASSEAPRLPSLAAPALGQGRKLRTLVIDDDPAICRALRRLLGRGQPVTTEEAPREAIARLERGERFDLIICDLMMPNLCGQQFFACVRERWPEQAERILFMTGGVFSASAQAFIDAHPERVIDKPFDSGQISKLIERRLSHVSVEPTEKTALKEAEKAFGCQVL